MIYVKQCNFSVLCTQCQKRFQYKTKNRLTDIGWNPIEGQKSITAHGRDCHHQNLIPLIWNDTLHYKTIGTII